MSEFFEKVFLVIWFMCAVGHISISVTQNDWTCFGWGILFSSFFVTDFATAIKRSNNKHY